MSSNIEPYYLYAIETPLLGRVWNLVFSDSITEAFKEGSEWHETFYELSEQEHKGNIKKTEQFLENTKACVVPLVNSNRMYLILPKNASPEMIAHESFHLALMICEFYDMKLNSTTEELYARLIEWIVKTVNEYHKEVVSFEEECRIINGI